MGAPVTIGTTGSDGGSVTTAQVSKLRFLGRSITPSLQGDSYVAPGTPPRTGLLQPLARRGKYLVNGRPLILDGDLTGTGGTLNPEPRLVKFQFRPG